MLNGSLNLIEIVGGFDDIVEDIFGYPHKICDYKDGYFGNRRLNFLQTTENTKLVQREVSNKYCL